MDSATGSQPPRQPTPLSRRSFSSSIECKLAAAPGNGPNGGNAVIALAEVADSDDKGLMVAFQERGSVAAFEELFRRYRLPLYRFLRGLARSAEIAEETSQHTWLKVIEAARQARFSAARHSSFKTWLFTLARNHYIDHYLRSHAHSRTSSNWEEALMDSAADADTVDARVDQERIAGTLEQLLGHLPLEQREVLVLWAQGHELTVIAEIAGVPWETVVSRKKYALAKLRAALGTAGLRREDV
jgi:RNA polymerase sigma-70 factor (ECF subfamily)